MTTPLHLGVVAPLDPDGVEPIVVAAAFRREVEHRLGPVVVDFRTTAAVGRPLDPTPWRELRTADWPSAVDAVVIDHRLAGEPAVDDALSGVDIVVTTELFEHPAGLASLLIRHLDAAALDSRRRMLMHLGVLPADSHTITEVPLVMPLTATDLYLVAQQLDSPDEPVLAAFAGHAADDQSAAINDLTEQLRTLIPDSRVETIDQLRERALAAERTLAHERARQELETRVINERLEHAEQLVEQYRRREALDETRLTSGRTATADPAP